MKPDYPYIITIIVLIIMLIGSNIQNHRHTSLLRAEIQVRDDLLMTNMAMMNRRMTDLRAHIIRVEKERDYLLGLRKRIQDPQGVKTF